MRVKGLQIDFPVMRGNPFSTSPLAKYKNAKYKLLDKSCDWIIANDVSLKDGGFESDYNEVTIFYKENEKKMEKLSLKKKSELSEQIVDRIVTSLN